jgi:hypothetical protein
MGGKVGLAKAGKTIVPLSDRVGSTSKKVRAVGIF